MVACSIAAKSQAPTPVAVNQAPAKTIATPFLIAALVFSHTSSSGKK